MILSQLGIFGWNEADEDLVLASLLTGDPLLLIGNHGCAKTHVANKVAQALGRKFLVYDASKAMFEDVLGYPNVEKLKQSYARYDFVTISLRAAKVTNIATSPRQVSISGIDKRNPEICSLFTIHADLYTHRQGHAGQ